MLFSLPEICVSSDNVVSVDEVKLQYSQVITAHLNQLFDSTHYCLQKSFDPNPRLVWA